MGTDLRKLTNEIFLRLFPTADKKLVLFGETKIYMKLE